MRVTDEKLRRLKLPGNATPLLRSLAKECLEARERGTMPTVDLAAQMSTNRIPVEMPDGLFLKSEGDAMTIAAWTPEPGGKGKTTQVHISMSLEHITPGARVVTRLKSGPAVDAIIRLLAEYRGEVWPGYSGVKVGL